MPTNDLLSGFLLKYEKKRNHGVIIFYYMSVARSSLPEFTEDEMREVEALLFDFDAKGIKSLVIIHPRVAQHIELLANYGTWYWSLRNWLVDWDPQLYVYAFSGNFKALHDHLSDIGASKETEICVENLCTSLGRTTFSNVSPADKLAFVEKAGKHYLRLFYTFKPIILKEK